MDNFDTHCFIEFYYNLNKGFLNEHYSIYTKEQLNEMYGVFNGCEELARELSDWILAWSRSVDTNRSIIKNKIIDTNWIKMVDAVLYKDIYSYTGAAYTPTKSKIIQNKFDPLHLEINLKEVTKESLLVKLMHELTHAYEDYNRIVNGKESLTDIILRKGNNHNMVGVYNDGKKYLSYLFYYIQGYERNAFMTELHAELKNSNKRFNKLSDIIAYLKQTKYYTNYMTICSWIDEYAQIDDKIAQENILKWVSEISNVNYPQAEDLWACHRRLSP